MPDTESPHREFAEPPLEFGMMPFWFWNDDLVDEEVLRQVREFHAKGLGGFIPSARIGLSRRVGYLTEEYFRLVRLAVDEAARLGMKVVLYDEGTYPSGSAQGQVVAENPAYASRCLIALHHRVEGPAAGFWRPNPGRAQNDHLVCVVQARETSPDVLDPESLTLLQADERELVRYEVGEGTWRLVAVWSVLSGGTIRGVFDEEEDGSALAPPAGDLMNPDAVACFLRLTHDAYYAHLKEHFGTTVVGMFTDEPSPMGRGPRRGPHPKPFTAGFLEDTQARWDADARLWLPALWLECGPRTGEFRRMYDRAVHDRIERVFYSAQSRWCAGHGIALTGHPEKSNEMGALRHFQWPGQDMVWRYVEPGKPTALEGGHSVAAKAASSAAAVSGRRRNTSEVLGAYGWRLNLDEAKWLFDWHLVRGNNLFFPHACFYSIRGRRAYESEPDLGVHNAWWPHFRHLADYVRRVCWLLTDGEGVCDVAVLTDPNHMAWAAAAELLPEQVDFLYIDAEALDRSRIEEGRLAIGHQRFGAVVCDPTIWSVSRTPSDRERERGRERERPHHLTTSPPHHPTTLARLQAFECAGGTVVREWTPGTLARQLAEALGRDVFWPDARDLRALHTRKGGRELYFVVNEGEETLEGDLSLAACGHLERWDPMDGSVSPWPARIEGGRLHTRLRLERRQGLVLAIDSAGTPDAVGANLVFARTPPVPGEVVAAVAGPWSAADAEGHALDLPCPGDWARVRGWETFTGTLAFRTTFTLSPEQAEAVRFLDLGRAGDIAEAFLNGERVGMRAWAPYVLDLEGHCRPGENRLEVRVTNSMANAYDGLQLPSGLLGPVVLRAAAGKETP